MAKTSKEQQVVERIARTIAEKGWSRAQLAAKAGTSTTSVNRALRGVFSSKTLAKIEKALPGISSLSPTASQSFGGYTSAQAERYIGRYILVTGRTSGGQHMMAWPVAIKWDGDMEALVMCSMLEDGAQGYIDMPTGSHQLLGIQHSIGR